MRACILAIALPLVVLAHDVALATTARDLSARMRVDGFTSDFAGDEFVFGFNAAAGAPQEAPDDSRWGVNNDINQIRITWDAQYLYVAGEGRVWDNNMILLFDTVPGRGLTSMTQLNSWRRNFDFDTTGAAAGGGFAPDLFAATWDGNTSPRLIVQIAGNQVDDQRVGPTFSAAATFLQANPDRAMELRIPWRTLFLGSAGVGTRDTFITVGGIPDTFRLFPRGTRIRICAAVTAGGDGTGGPDSAPDNLRGHSDNAGDLVFLDNYAIVDLDRNDDTGLGGGGPDGVADWNVDPSQRISFRFLPPVVAVRFAADEIELERPAFAPDRGDLLRFRVALDKTLDPTDPVSQIREYNLTANIYDLRGRLVRNLYSGQTRRVIRGDRPGQPDTFWNAATRTDTRDLWDGRDERGAVVPPGVYVVRTVIEPNLSRALRSVVVVR